MPIRRPTLRSLTLALAPVLIALGEGPGLFGPSAWHPMHQLLEQRLARADIGDPATLEGVIVLGGSEDRLREAARLARLYPHLKLFVSGAGERETIAAVIGDDLASQRLSYENRSTTTYENAVYSKRALAPTPGERWLLITSGVHMPRSVGAFRRVGFEVEPWPVLDRANMAWPNVRHEWLGLVGYYLLDKSDRIFPGGRVTRAPLPQPSPGM